MICCFVSGSTTNRMVGSSSMRRASAAPILPLVALLGHLDGHAVAADGVDRRGQRDDAGRVTQGVAGFGGGQLGDRADVTGGDLWRIGLLFAADSQRLAQALRLAGAGVDGVARAVSLPDRTLIKLSLPTKGSATVLNT